MSRIFDDIFKELQKVEDEGTLKVSYEDWSVVMNHIISLRSFTASSQHQINKCVFYTQKGKAYIELDPVISALNKEFDDFVKD